MRIEPTTKIDRVRSWRKYAGGPIEHHCPPRPKLIGKSLPSRFIMNDTSWFRPTWMP
jgi:hypothetical protein